MAASLVIYIYIYIAALLTKFSAMKTMILLLIGGFYFSGDLPTSIESECDFIEEPTTRIVTMSDPWTIETWQDFDDGFDCTVYIYRDGSTWATGPDC